MFEIGSGTYSFKDPPERVGIDDSISSFGNGEEDTVEFRKIVREGIEYRFDPLTQNLSRLNPARAKRLKQAEISDQVQGLVQRSARTCPFCPARIAQVTPTFPPELWEDGRVERGETLIFPNLNPFGEHHAVGTITRAHYLELDAFHPGQLLDNLAAAKTYFHAAHRYDARARFPVYIWNYMPPSAGSILHPHVQLMLEQEALPRLQHLLEQSRRYERDYGSSYWRDLTEAEEQRGERFIAKNASFTVLATFAPRGFREIAFVFHEANCLVSLDKASMTRLAKALLRALRGYKSMGVGSFNLVSYSAPMGASVSYFPLLMVLISRPYPSGVYTNDTGALERLYDTWVIDTRPEDVAQAMRPHFGAS